MVIYGPANYTEQTFFDYRFSNSIIQLKKILCDSGVIVLNDGLLSAHVKELKEKRIDTKKQSLKMTQNSAVDNYIEQCYISLVNNKVLKAKVKKVSTVYNRLVF